jgi:mannan endo-1,4-beta-mannosidase
MKFTKYFCSLGIALVLAAGSGVGAQPILQDSVQKEYEPVNKKADPEAKQLLHYLYSISGKKIIAGQHGFSEKPDFFIDTVKGITGKKPEIWGGDFIDYYKEGNGKNVIINAFKKYKEGYIINLMWHQGRPLDTPPYGWKESIQNKMTDSEWVELITPGTKLNKKWQAEIDVIAMYLLDLKMLHVPVLWRPYHELNGVWFWWGNRKGENGSAKLYKMMYDRYVNYFHLDNLIWVWGPNSPRDLPNDEAYAYEDFFPGLEYVDVLAADIYHSDFKQSHYEQLLELGKGKVIAMSEVGEVPPVEVLARQPKWTWFLIWADFVYSHNTPESIRSLYNYPNVITHEDMLKEYPPMFYYKKPQ